MGPLKEPELKPIHRNIPGPGSVLGVCTHNPLSYCWCELQKSRHQSPTGSPRSWIEVWWQHWESPSYWWRCPEAVRTGRQPSAGAAPRCAAWHSERAGRWRPSGRWSVNLALLVCRKPAAVRNISPLLHMKQLIYCSMSWVRVCWGNIKSALTSLPMRDSLLWWCRSNVHRKLTGLPVRMLATNSLFSPTATAAQLPPMESPRTSSITSTCRCRCLELTWAVRVQRVNIQDEHGIISKWLDIRDTADESNLSRTLT